MSRIVSLLNLGRLGYSQALKIQQRLVTAHLNTETADNKSKNVLILVEHNPVYTIGIRTNEYSDEEVDRLRNLGAEFYRTNRGGLITFHGPGQLVCYPILNLRDFADTTSNLKAYVCNLEQMVIELCAQYDIEARRTEDTGIWVGNSKICALGIHASRRITSHGLALNCNTDLSWFRNIVPCGLVGKGVTSISDQLLRDVPMSEVVPKFLSGFQKTFNCQIFEPRVNC